MAAPDRFTVSGSAEDAKQSTVKISFEIQFRRGDGLWIAVDHFSTVELAKARLGSARGADDGDYRIVKLTEIREWAA